MQLSLKSQVLSIECFVALNGSWAVTLGMEGEEEVMLEPFGEFSVPPGIMRGLRNVGTEPAHILAILGGTDPGKQHGRHI